jgi:hypothetical protein
MKTILLKLSVLVGLILAAPVLAGAYGAIHNQVSYTVSPEYFTRFKFEQFHINPVLSDRLGAALVGWFASWWMGVPIGLVLAPVGLFFRDARRMLREVLRAYGLVVAVTLVVGLSALLVVSVAFEDRELVASYGRMVPESVEDRAAFLRAGIMHDFGYLGGAVGLLVGLGFSVVRVVRHRNRPPDPPGT